MTGLVVRLSRAWGVSPVALRDVTMGEMDEMAAVLEEERRRG
jgi:hypothetical protein